MEVKNITGVIATFFFLVSYPIISGCATIMGGSENQITIVSYPSPATVIITDEDRVEAFKGETPVTVTLKPGSGYFQGKDYTVLVTKSGFRRYTIFIRSQLNEWYLGNLFSVGLIGLLVDPLTGAMWKLSPDNIFVTLERETTQEGMEEGTLIVVFLQDVPDYLHSRMVRIR
jgi:hypothetical protein